jgi:hypothetical protein
MRTTQKDVQRAFERLVYEVMHGRVAERYNDVGAYQLDYNGTYGGCQVQVIINKAGGVRCPFGLTRMSPAELVSAVRFICDVLRERDEQEEAA